MNVNPMQSAILKIMFSFFIPLQLLFLTSATNTKKNNTHTQVELENWVNSIHSACAAAFARHRGKTGTLHLLQEEIFRLDKAIESVGFMS